MLKINNRDVSEYFKDKDVGEKLNNLTQVLYKAHCSIFEITPNKIASVHFCEALYLFAGVNSSKESHLENLLDFNKRVDKFCKAKTLESDIKITFSPENEGDWFDWVEENANELQKGLNALYRNYKVIPKRPEFPGCDYYIFTAQTCTVRYLENYKQKFPGCDYYIFTAQTCTVGYLENYKQKFPYSNLMLAALYEFCKANSPTNKLSGQEMKSFYKMQSFI